MNFVFTNGTHYRYATLPFCPALPCPALCYDETQGNALPAIVKKPITQVPDSQYSRARKGQKKKKERRKKWDMYASVDWVG